MSVDPYMSKRATTELRRLGRSFTEDLELIVEGYLGAERDITPFDAQGSGPRRTIAENKLPDLRQCVYAMRGLFAEGGRSARTGTWALVQAFPGAHLQDLAFRMDCSPEELEPHLTVLRERKEIKTRGKGSAKQYFPRR